MGCFVLAAAIAWLLAWAGIALRWWILLVLGLLPLAFVLQCLYIVVLRARAWRGSAASRIDVIVVTSDSPRWRDIIRSEWLPHMPRNTVVLNWSERKRWRPSLATRLYRAHAGHCPVVMIMKGLQHPMIFEFWRAFRDHKHGKPLALETMQRRMFDELREIRTQD